ncbi:hypothetical protein MRX96_046106 [Rhipicephalus microplus]
MDYGRTRRIPPVPRHASSSGCPRPCRLRRSLRLCGQRRGSGSYWITGTTDCASVQPNTEEVRGSTTAVPKPTITLTQLPLEVMFQIFLHCDGEGDPASDREYRSAVSVTTVFVSAGKGDEVEVFQTFS